MSNPPCPVKPAPPPRNVLVPHGFLLKIAVHGFKTSNLQGCGAGAKRAENRLALSRAPPYLKPIPKRGSG